MNILCLVVFSIVGAYCYNAPIGYEPPGNCSLVQRGVYTCFVEPEDLQVRASWYNPEIGYGKDWDINCQEPCHVLGDGTEVSESFGIYLACPPGWYGRRISFKNIGTRQCRDSGSAIVPTCREVFVPGSGREFHCFIVVDFVEREQPHFAYLLLDWVTESENKIPP